MENNCSKSFSDTSNSSDIAEELIKQIKALRLFNMELRTAIPKKYFVSKEENNLEEKINLKPQDTIRNIHWYISFCFRKNPGAQGEHLAIRFLWTTTNN